MSKNKIKSLSAIKFFSIMKERKTRFAQASKTPIPADFPVNTLAKKLHPQVQYVKISEIRDRANNTKTYTLVPNLQKGTESLAYFSAGQYISVEVEINGRTFSRPYSICSSLKEAIQGKYEITVKSVSEGLVSNYIADNWQVGTELKVSSPQGNFDYVALRDAATVIGIAGGSGITPFLSMAKAIAEGSEDFSLILLYGSRNFEQILFRDELNELQQKCDRIKVVHVLSDENHEDCEKGFINQEIIQKYAPKTEYSVFICGPQIMTNFVDAELKKMNILPKFIRHELFGEIHGATNQADYPDSNKLEKLAEGDRVKITITVHDKKQVVYGKPDDTILQILEQNNVSVPSRCRSGECGWCHTFLKSGKVYIPKGMDYRRKADVKFGFIHPCCTFPLTDLELEN